MAYLTTCLSCGAQLQPVVLGPDSPPWLCGPTGCAHAFWACELSPDARRAWKPTRRSFHSWAHPVLDEGRRAEFVAAHRRGTSALPEHLPLLSVAQLQALSSNPRLEASFLSLVQAALKAKGA